MALTAVLAHHSFKQRARYLLENLAENAGYSCQGLVLGSVGFCSWRNVSYPTRTLPSFRRTLIWTGVVEYRRSAHAVFDIMYHVVWITRCRYKVLKGRIAERARDLIRQICEARDVVIVCGSVAPDHSHMLLSVPAYLSTATMVQYIKRRSSRRLQDELPELRKPHWGRICGYADTLVRRWARSMKR